ncbi:MAG: efflux RND transporter periplasmic adaptor subunit [Gemmatimonadetes bacterium]|nr:efflux RND transporter periplasmic adaptor subunit [Gemmatimonadota bacterium]
MKRIPWLVFLPALLACQEEVVVSVYQAVPVATRDISVSAQAAGVIEPDTTVEVKSKASGEILEIMVQTGDRVERGALMVRVDQRIPRNSLLQSEASLEVARARLANALAQKRRSDELYQTQSITQTEYEDTLLDYANAKAGLVQAEVAVENDRIAMDDTDVRAPISGTIIAKNVERGQVISSPTRDVAGGTVLLTMADLSLVQVRTLVDETDIGKIRPGLDATVSVASYPNQPFEGQVLKIEPMAETQQNVTMFPVLIRIPNTDGLLRPGMNAEVEISIGRREGVLAVPNAALRTDRDVGSAAEVLGLTLEAVQAQLARSPEVPSRQASSPPAAEASDRETLTLRNGRTVELPPGVTAEQARTIMNKRRSGEPLTEDEQEIGRQMFQAFQGGRGGEPGRGAEPKQQAGNIQIADYVVFVLRDGVPTAVRIKTGLTDLDYSEVLAGLTAADSVLVLRNIAQQAS